MNSLEKIDRGHRPVEHKKNYEMPKITTFGSVARLTMGSLSRNYDSKTGTYTHDRGHN